MGKFYGLTKIIDVNSYNIKVVILDEDSTDYWFDNETEKVIGSEIVLKEIHNTKKSLIDSALKDGEYITKAKIKKIIDNAETFDLINEINFKNDLKRAISVADYINNHLSTKRILDCDLMDIDIKSLYKIKTKYSKSKFYNNNYENMVSRYHYCVPIEVKDCSIELLNLRKKYSGNNNFDFYKTEIVQIVVREADHNNESSLSGVEVSEVKIPLSLKIKLLGE